MRQILSFLILPGIFIACKTTPVSMISGAGSHPLSIMQGVTSEKWTRLNLLRPKSKTYEVQFLTQDGASFPETLIRRQTREFGASDWVVDAFFLDGLNAKGTFRMLVKEDGKVIDERSFSGLDPKKKSYHFAVLSCADDFYKDEQKGMWRSLAGQKPDFILAIGDNVYTDWRNHTVTPEPSPTSLWSRYVETRNALELYHLDRLIPVVAVWDDHDYGMNDGDRRNKFKNESLLIFQAFFPQDFNSPEFAHGPGASSILKLGGQSFVLLDDRYFRSPNQQSPICKKKSSSPFCAKKNEKLAADPLAKAGETHFGAEQEKWLWDQLNQAQGPVFLISGDQWFGAYSPFESYEGNQPASFKKFMKKLAQMRMPVVFIGGDRHASEISKIEKSLLGYETFEIISSPIHAKIFPSNWEEFPNPRQVASVANVFNYTMMDSGLSDATVPLWDVNVRNIKMGGATSFEHRFSLSLEFSDQ